MAKKDYKKLSDDIIAACGGVDNILSASHCMTRLRMNLKDSSVLDLEKAKEIPGVINVVVQNGEQQFVIGQDVASLFPIHPYSVCRVFLIRFQEYQFSRHRAIIRRL